MKIRFLWLAALVLAVFSSGCATVYQKDGTDGTGGYSFTRLSEDTFEVLFRGNGFTEPKRARDFATLRAAEICLDHNFRYFSVIGDQDRSRTDYAYVNRPTYTAGTVNTYGGGWATYSATTYGGTSEIPIRKPATQLTIKCYVARPGGHAGPVEDAPAVRAALRAKYRLDKRN